MSAEDVLEFLNAGASAVEIGAANFHDPWICKKIIDELPSVLEKYRYNSVQEAVGRSFLNRHEQNNHSFRFLKPSGSHGFPQTV